MLSMSIRGNSHGLPSWIMILMGISRLRFSTTKLVRLFVRKSIAVGRRRSGGSARPDRAGRGGRRDRGRAGRPDLIEYNALGRLDSVEFIDRTTGRVKKRMYYKLDAKVREEIDEDGDGKFERVIEFDEFENPK